MKKFFPSFLSFVLFFSSFILFFAEEVDLREISVVVTDKKGNFIEGLRKEDFEIYENKKKQNISGFYFKEIIDGKLFVKYENGEERWEPRTCIIIFDQYSTEPFSLQRIKESLNNFPDEYFNTEDNIYFFLDRHIIAWQGRRLTHLSQEAIPIKNDDLKHNIISDILSNLTKEVVDDIFTPEKYSEITETPDKAWHPRQKPEEYLPHFELNYKKFSALSLLDRLKAIAQAAGKIEGEKIALLISESPQRVIPSPLKSEKKGVSSYITGGFFRGKEIDEEKGFMPSFNYPSSLGELLSHSRTTLYSVLLEPTRLKTPLLESTDLFKNTIWVTNKADSQASQAIPKMDLDSAESVYQNVIKRLSKETGGIAITHTKNAMESLSQIGQVMHKSYVLSYFPSDKKKDGKFRKIKIKINKNSVRLRHRKGYYAIDEDQEELKELINSLEKNTRSEKLTAFVKSKTFPLKDDEHYLLAKIEPKGLTLNDIFYLEKEMIKSSLISNIHLFFRLEDEEGKLKKTINKKFDIKIDESHLSIRPAIYFGQELKKGKYRIKLALKDRIGEEITTLEEVIQIEKEGSKDERGKALGNVFFVKRDSLIQELNEIEELFTYEGEKLYPRMDDEFKPEENLSLYFEVNSEDEKGVDLYFKIITEDERVFKTYRMSPPLRRKITPLLISIPLKDFPYGRYVLQMIAIEQKMRTYSIARIDFSVIF